MTRDQVPATVGGRDGLTILLIEDSVTYAELAVCILAELGHTVHLGRSAEAGLLVARTLDPDLMLVDIHLPQQSGYDAVRLLRQDPRFAAVPIVAMTITEPVIEPKILLGREAGFTAFIEKPMDSRGFRALIQAHTRPVGP